MRKQEDVTSAILEAALDIFAEGDFHKTNIRKIARRANVGIGTIYRYFHDKEHLLFSVLQSKTDEIVAGTQEHLKGIEGTFNKLRKLLWYILNFYQTDKRIGVLLYIVVPLKSWMTDPFFRKSPWNQMITNIFKEGQGMGEVRNDIDAVIMMDTVYTLVERYFQMWVLRQKPKNLTDHANLITEIVYKAFRKEAETGYILECPVLKEYQLALNCNKGKAGKTGTAAYFRKDSISR